MRQVCSPIPADSTLVRRLLVASALAVGGASLLQAQIPGRNVNMVSGVTLPEGDPYLQRQNEPSIAASTRNPLHLLAGANDYRTVDLPGLPGTSETGDAWMGVFKSYDGGNTWRTTLMPGFPQDPTNDPANPHRSPLAGYAAAADPVVRAGTNGLFYYSGIVFDREAPTRSALFVSRFIDNNNQEAGDPIVFLDTKIVSSNAGTAFIDKPWFAVDIPRANAQMCVIQTSQKSPTPGNPDRTVTTTQSFPGGAAYTVFSVITGDAADTRSQVYLSRSTDCGATWSAPVQISASVDPINQGATLAIDPRNGSLYVAWRRFSADGTDDSIMVTRSVDQGRKWDPPGRARRFPRGRKVGLTQQIHGKKFKQPQELAELSSLDQPTMAEPQLVFRTNAYPTMTVDESGRVYVAWAERGFGLLNPDPDDGDARIVMASSTTGAEWTAPVAVDNGPFPGHQIMPTLTFAGGKLMVAYYDFRDDVSAVFRRWIDEQSALYYSSPRKRHTVDIRAAMGTPGPSPSFAPSVRVSEYLMGSRHLPDGTVGPVQQLQYNPPNLKLFKLGTVPFLGDYIDITPSPAFVPAAGGGWSYNSAPASSPLFHVAWTDNRDIVPPADGDWTSYTPPGAVAGTSTYDGTTDVLACAPGRTGMRNQNIYTARITGGLVAGSPGNTKPLSRTLPRAFVVFAQNATEQVRTFKLTIQNQPVGGRASFEQLPLPPYGPGAPPPAVTLQAIVPPRSTVARHVFATSSDPDARIHVSVAEVAAVDGPLVTGGMQAVVVLNPDISNPDISNPDISNPDISNPDISNAEVSNPDISNPDVSNPDISNPDISNPDISNPDISNPDISNPDVSNPDISNPDISNPDVSNPDISNPDISNPDISNPDVSNQSLTDTTWTVTNEGNTTAAYSVKLLLNGAAPTSAQAALQLILRKIYTTPVASACTLTLQAHNVLLANIVNPVFTAPSDIGDPDISNPNISNATLWLAPGETARITLRVFDKALNDGYTFDAEQQVTPAIVSQALNVSLVGGVLVAAETVIVATPPALNVDFPNLAAAGVAGAPLGSVSVRVRDSAGAPLPGAGVTLSVLTVPDGELARQPQTSTSNSDGYATFIVAALPAGTYRLVAETSSPGFPPTTVYSEQIVISPNPNVVEWTVASQGNGHFYEYVRVTSLTWSEAQSAAAARSHNGFPGRLVSITSEAENTFVNSLRNGEDMRAWIGLSDADGTGAYSWVGGDPFDYSRWAPGEPTTPGVERWVEMFGDGTWNNNQQLDPNPAFRTTGYIVEYPLPSPAGVSGVLTFNSVENPIGAWTQNVPQTFRLTVNMDAHTASLSVNGLALDNAQNVPFAATTLSTISVDLGTTGTQLFSWEDITVRDAAGAVTLFSADFTADTVDQPPGPPAVGTWAVANMNGYVLVRQSSGNLVSKPVEISQAGGTNNVALTGTLTGAPDAGVWIVEWTSVMADPGSGYPGFIFAPVIVRGNGGIIASIEYR